MSDTWYLDADDYWVAPHDATEYPLRQGDVIRSPFLLEELGWHAALIVHPTCELVKPKVTEVQVSRIHELDELPDSFQRSVATAGFVEASGHRQVAVAHTFFVAPLPSTTDPLVANFRTIVSIPKHQVGLDTRAAAMTHDCRVTLIRRWLYFRFRQKLSVETVRDWEASRIRGDKAFAGPRPKWAR